VDRLDRALKKKQDVSAGDHFIYMTKERRLFGEEKFTGTAVIGKKKTLISKSPAGRDLGGRRACFIYHSKEKGLWDNGDGSVEGNSS